MQTIGVAILSLLALLALAPGAFASTTTYFESSPGATITTEAEGGLSLSFGNKDVTCGSLDGAAESSGRTTDLLAEEAGLSGCETSLFNGLFYLPTDVIPSEGCQFDYNAGSWDSESETATGSMQICDLTIKQWTNESRTTQYCEEQVPAQDIEGIAYDTVINGEALRVTANADATISGVEVANFHRTGCNTEATEDAEFTGDFSFPAVGETEEDVGTKLVHDGLFEAEAGATQVTGQAQGYFEFTVGGSEFIECEEVSLADIGFEGAAAELTGTPQFGSCFLRVGTFKLPASVYTNGCKYQLAAGLSSYLNGYGSYGNDSGVLSLVDCAYGITFTTKEVSCEYTILPQEGAEGDLSYTNLGSGAEREVEASVYSHPRVAYNDGWYYCGHGAGKEGEMTSTQWNTWKLSATSKSEERLGFWLD